jgi:hypothetical protein
MDAEDSFYHAVVNEQNTVPRRPRIKNDGEKPLRTLRDLRAALAFAKTQIILFQSNKEQNEISEGKDVR